MIVKEAVSRKDFLSYAAEQYIPPAMAEILVYAGFNLGARPEKVVKKISTKTFAKMLQSFSLKLYDKPEDELKNTDAKSLETNSEKVHSPKSKTKSKSKSKPKSKPK